MGLEQLFQPKGVVVVGASRNPTKLGYGVARNLVVSGYPGALHFVNPHGGTLFDHPIYSDVADVPDPVDLAVIMIPARAVPGALEACGRRGIPFAVVGAGGFRETDEAGRALEARALETAQKFGMRVLGPNCIGFLDTHIPIDTSFLPLPGPIPGDIAFLSHSGAICEAVIDWARGQGFGLSRLVSLGNQMDLTEADLLVPTADDPNTNVVAMYLEGVADGQRFIEQARQVTRHKPVVAIKVGRSQAGRDAVASHTGALAGRDEAYDAAFRKARVLRARHSEEMFDWARALAWCPLPQSPRMAVLTNAGGPGAIAADSLEANGLTLARLSEHTNARLAELLPAAASLHNPVDMLAGAGPREYADGLRALLADEGVDGVILILPPPPVTTAAEVAGAVIPVIRSTAKPVVVALMGEELIAHAARLFRQAHIPDYRFPERAASVLSVLYARGQQLTAADAAPATPFEVDVALAKDALQAAAVGPGGFLSGWDAAHIVAAYGMKPPRQELVSSPQEAYEAAQSIGGLLAMKIDSAAIPHKSDHGGVKLDLEGGEACARAYKELVEAARKAFPDAAPARVIVQQMIPGGEDAIVGVVRDAQFGPLVMFGSGGVDVEALRDVAFELAPLNQAEAQAMIDRTIAGRRLAGLRGRPPADREAVVQALLRISQLALDLPEIAEVEINPLRVRSQGGGALALDVRMRVAGEKP